MTSSPYSRRTVFQVGAASLAGLAGAAAGLPAPALASDSDLFVRSSYFLEPGLIYLNTGSLGPTSKAVFNQTMEAWTALEANPVRNSYGDGAVLAEADTVRGRAAALLGCAADDILITRGTSEGMSLMAQSLRLSPGDRVLATDQEHGGGSVGWEHRARRDGVVLDRIVIAPDEHDGDAIVRRFAAALTPATRVISFSHVITSTGLRMPVAEISALARTHGALCIVDGAQAVGSIPVDVRVLGCHVYATSGHKWLMGPKGTGLLYISPEAAEALAPPQWELSRRYVSDSTGMGALPSVVGLGAAIDALQAIGMVEVERRIVALRDRAYEAMMQIPGLRVMGPPPGPLATALVAGLLPERIDSAELRTNLRDRHGVVIKMVEKRWFNGVRLSPHLFNTEADIDAAVQALRIELA